MSESDSQRFKRDVLPPDALRYGPNLLFVISADGHILQVGGPARELTGQDPEVFLDTPLRSHILPRDHYMVPESMTELEDWNFRYRHPLEFHLRFGEGGGDEASDGRMAGSEGNEAKRWRLFSVTATRIDPDSGNDVMLMSLQPVGAPGNWDVSRQLLLEAIEAADSCIVIADLRQEDQPLVYCNQGFFKLTQYSREELIGKNCRLLQRRADGTRDDDQPMVHRMRRAIDNGEFVSGRLRNYRKSGDLFHNELYLTPVRQDDDLVAFIGVQNDVTRHVESENELRKSEESIRSFFDASSLHMGLLELESGSADPTSPEAWRRAVFVNLNRAACEFFQCEQEKAVGMTLLEVGLPGEVEICFAAGLARAMKTGEHQHFDCLLSDGDEERVLRVVATRVRPGDGEPPRCSFIADDVTELEADRRHQAALERQVIDIQQFEQQRIARDLHDTVAQGLNVLNLYLSSLQSELEPGQSISDDQMEQLGDATEQAKQIGSQIRSISHSLSPVDVTADQLGEALQRMGERLARNDGPSIVVDVTARLPIDDGTARQLYQIAAEALANAVRHAQASIVRCSITAQDGSGQLSIRDNGVGVGSIDTDNLDQAGPDGAGIGLRSMTYRARLIGGDLDIKPAEPSHPQKPGTAITVNFNTAPR